MRSGRTSDEAIGFLLSFCTQDLRNTFRWLTTADPSTACSPDRQNKRVGRFRASPPLRMTRVAGRLSARLKPCPDTKQSKASFPAICEQDVEKIGKQLPGARVLVMKKRKKERERDRAV